MHTDKVITYFSNHPFVTIGMEVGIGTQYLAKQLNKQGHTTKVMPAKNIEAFYMGQKNDEQAKDIEFIYSNVPLKISKIYLKKIRKNLSKTK